METPISMVPSKEEIGIEPKILLQMVPTGLLIKLKLQDSEAEEVLDFPQVLNTHSCLKLLLNKGQAI